MNMTKTGVAFLVLLLVACAGPPVLQSGTVVPEKGQPPFPKLGITWVIDANNSCRFSPESVNFADQTFEKLRQDHIAEVVVICQTGIKNFGPFNDEKIWLMGWGNWSKLGDAKDKRGLIWLIRPDVKPEENRVTLTNADWLYQYTVIDYFKTLESAAGYANYGKFSEALELIARETNEKLRQVVKP